MIVSMLELKSLAHPQRISPATAMMNLIHWRLMVAVADEGNISKAAERCGITPKGYVAALMLDSGEVLTEGPAIVQYLADLRPAAGLAPPNGTWTRVRLQEWLNFITSEIHAGSAPLFSAELPETIKSFFKRRLFKRFEYLVDTLRDQPYLLGAHYSVADAYLYTVLRWMKHFSIDLHDWPRLQAFFERVDSRPAVKAALAAEAASLPVGTQD
jgi:glutathione S-transferase